MLTLSKMNRTAYFSQDSYSMLSEDSYQRSGISSKASSSRSANIRETNSNRIGFTNRTDSKPKIKRNTSRHTPVLQALGKVEPKRNSNGTLTRKILHSGISKVAIPSSKDRDIELEYQYGNILVLHLQCKNLTWITPGILDPFSNLKNLYLYKNSIRRIQGLELLINLEILDLSRNNVERMDNLEHCTNLKIIYLGFNEIQMIEGLESLTSLEELHVDDQDIPPEQPLIFAPGIMASIANTLTTLDICSNQLSNLDPIANLPILDTLLAANNCFANLDEILPVLETLRKLRVLTLKGNPIASKPSYRSQVIGVVWRLEILDTKEINDTTRDCLQRLRLLKEYRAQQQKEVDQMTKLKNEQIAANQIHMDLGTSSEFSFSTPTRLSPQPPQLPPVKLPPHVQRQQAVNKRKSQSIQISKKSTTPCPSDFEDSRPSTSQDMVGWSGLQLDSPVLSQTHQNTMELPSVVIDSSFYESRARNHNGGGDEPSFNLEDKISETAKIIFRLANLDQDADETEMKHPSFWDFPGTSMTGTGECRPLSPLEGLESLLIPALSVSSPEIGREMPATNNKRMPGSGQNATGNRPKPASPGGRRSGAITKTMSDTTVGNEDSFNSSRYYYGRTLSPLVELPTPESATARDDI